MLIMLGGVALSIWPVNPTETSKESGAEYVEKPVMGRRPPLEFVGEAAEDISITARMFPAKLGGLGSLVMLHTMRKSGIAQYMIRGDGVPFGWVVIEKISEKHSHLDAQGVGQVIDLDISVKRSDPPTGGDFYSSIAGIMP